MRKLTWLCVAVLAVALPAGAARAGETAQDPQAIADECVNRATELADTCVEANEDAADACVERIEQLLAEGKTALARRVGRQCVKHITRRSDVCAHRIRQLCRHCTRVLLRLGEPELAREVRAACGEQLEKVRASQREATQRIRDALGGIAE